MHIVRANVHRWNIRVSIGRRARERLQAQRRRRRLAEGGIPAHLRERNYSHVQLSGDHEEAGGLGVNVNDVASLVGYLGIRPPTVRAYREERPDGADMLLQQIYAPLPQPLGRLPELVRPGLKVVICRGKYGFQSAAS